MGLSSRGGKMLITPSPVATTPVIQRLSREYFATAIINLNGQFNILYIFYEDC